LILLGYEKIEIYPTTTRMMLPYPMTKYEISKFSCCFLWSLERPQFRKSGGAFRRKFIEADAHPFKSRPLPLLQ
jgi:hypothetical protein